MAKKSSVSDSAASKSGPGDGKSRRSRNRREAILTEAAKLFRRLGFHATGIDEIGAAVGITGPGVYRHFDSKQDLLAAILDRSLSRHREIVTEAKECGLPPREALRLLVSRSAEELTTNSDAAAIYFQEARNLAPDQLTKFTRIQRLLVTEWAQLLRNARPELSEEDARVAVGAVGGMLNSVGYFTTSTPPDRLAQLLTEMSLAALLVRPDE